MLTRRTSGGPGSPPGSAPSSRASWRPDRDLEPDLDRLSADVELAGGDIRNIVLAAAYAAAEDASPVGCPRCGPVSVRVVTTLRDRLRAGETLYGGWSHLLGPVALGTFAVGLDYAVVDLQHGVAAEADLPALCAAVEATGAVPLARARSADGADLARALDLGAHGVVVPSLASLGAARAAVAACRYPPAGVRSTGRVSGGADEPLVVLMVETPGLLAEVDALVRLDGLDAVYVGPWDLSLGLGCAPDPDDPVLAAALDRVVQACATADVPLGIHAQDPATALRYRGRGCRLVTLVADRAVIGEGTAGALAAARR